MDRNQKEVVELLRRHDYEVLLLHAVGQGCPDLLVSKHGLECTNILVEVKDGKKGRLTGQQIEFMSRWPGPLVVAYSADEALTACNNITDFFAAARQAT